LFEGSGEAFAQIDARGRVDAWNSRAEDVFGIDRDKALGQELFAMVLAPEEHQRFY
jgi:PAS domain S-box-containing protein